MSPVIPFRRRSRYPRVPSAIGVLAAIALGAAAIAAWMIWQRSSVSPSGQIIEVIDGDTVRLNGAVYRLVGFDTPERGDKARCDDERRRAEAATTRLRGLIAGGGARLNPVSCSRPHGPEGTQKCNYARPSRALFFGGVDVSVPITHHGLPPPPSF